MLFSCNNKNIDRSTNIENNSIFAFSQEFYENVEMIYPIEYYKEIVTEYQADKLGGTIDDLNNHLLNISSIVIIDNFTPNLLSFLVQWSDIISYLYYIFTFDENQNIVNRHFINFLRLPNNHRQRLMEKLAGVIIENEVISIGDFNNDGLNEILSYSWHQNIGNVFTVYGYNILERGIVEFLQVPVFINYDEPFLSVEYIENGFRILEIFENEPLELAWNNYIWDIGEMKYLRQ